MTDSPWLGDACSLVDAFRSGTHSPVDELAATLAAIEASQLNAFCYIDADAALARAQAADVTLPFGGVPVGIKELEKVSGWPATDGSLAFRDRTAQFTSTHVERLVGRGGANPVGQTTSSEFGGLACSITKIHGVTHNPWQHGRTTGGSSAGSSAAVAGGLATVATGGDGGGSIRIPAGYCGLFGMKGTAGRIPRGPRTEIGPLTIVLGCVARSVRDAARWFDVANGFDARDPYSLPRVDGWERGLGSYASALRGKRVAIAPTLGSAVVRPEVEAIVRDAGEALAKRAGLQVVDVDIKVPDLGLEWLIANAAVLFGELGDRWPDCKDDLTPEIAFLGELTYPALNMDVAAANERARTSANEAMAAIFDQVDFVISATNPDVAFGAEASFASRIGEVDVELTNSGVLTIPANVVGNPAMSVPAGLVDDLPVGMQVIGRHHEDALLFDLALVAEREQPWPMVAPLVPR
jgi:aspartyl-tRNA(Asn)/glutamyl-tRNA(Gln) amidotransferase subunit A